MGLLIFGIVFFTFVFIAIIIFSFIISENNSRVPGTSPSPTLIQPVTQPLIKYDLRAQNKLYENIQNTNNFSAADLKAKESIINNLLSGQTGTLYTSSNVSLSYIKSADIFQGEILTTNIDLAKQETVTWFTNHGVSKQGVCRLPLMFFLGQNASDQLQNTETIFSPLPLGC